MIYADFESFLISEKNGNQNPNTSHTNKYQNHLGHSYDYKLVWADDQFSKRFNSYLGQDTVHKFITSMVKESKYYSRVMKKNFDRNLLWLKKIMAI